MKLLKKCLSAALMLALLLTLCLPVLADTPTATETGSITIENAVAGKTYTLYRLMDLTDHTADYSGVRYQVAANWSDFFADADLGGKYIAKDSQGYVTWKSDALTAQQLAEEAIRYLSTLTTPMEYDGQATAASDADLSFTNLKLGYYLIKSELGTLCLLDTTKPNLTVTEKNSAPTSKKEVQENSKINDQNEGWGTSNDANIGDTVKFRSTVYVQDGAPSGYVFHDKMSIGLTFLPDTLKVTQNGAALTSNDYTLVTAEGDKADSTCTFEVKLDCTLKTNDVLVFTYSAVLNASAAISGENTNESRITWKNGAESTWHKTVTETWKLDVYKYAQKGQEQLPLGGVKFILYRENGTQTEYLWADENNKAVSWTTNRTLPTDADSTAVVAKEFVTDSDGKLSILGLDSGSYYLEEIEALPGYRLLASAITVNIDATGNVSYTLGETEGTGTINVLNKEGQKLPSTGGVGTTIFYLTGGTLVLAAGVMLMARKRAEKEI